eukprot:g7766.t1
MSVDGGKPSPPRPDDFVPEAFCDEVYDYADDSLADEMDNMESALLKAAPQTGGADQGGGSSSSSIEASIKICCDNVQKRIQKDLDRNIDILDRYIKKNAAALASGNPSSARVGAAGEAVRAVVNNGAAPTVGGSNAKTGAGAGGGAGAVAAAGGASSAKGGADAWLLDVDEATPPKRLEEEEALDAEIQQLRKRRREGLRRCAAMVRKCAREDAVLSDAKDYVHALKGGEASSFADNGLTPLPSKVQEAVQSCAELKATAARAQELTRRLEREQAIESVGPAAGGGSSSGAVASTVPPPRDLQAMFQQSSEQQVIAGGASEYSALETRLRR